MGASVCVSLCSWSDGTAPLALLLRLVASAVPALVKTFFAYTGPLGRRTPLADPYIAAGNTAAFAHMVPHINENRSTPWRDETNP